MTNTLKNKISRRVNNTNHGVKKGTIPESYTAFWASFNSETGEIKTKPTRRALRNFIRNNPKFSGVRRILVVPSR